jgi:hypothetical protein
MKNAAYYVAIPKDWTTARFIATINQAVRLQTGWDLFFDNPPEATLANLASGADINSFEICRVTVEAEAGNG